ncbi:MAG: S4 domain-containing protein [Pseudomonadaceae bacterium]|nr:S4 domain-containing protein [Pseudomonadaceae bacterium]
MSRAKPETPDTEPVRLDSWLWAARFFKTRSLARDAIEGGKVTVNGARSKPSKLVNVGMQIDVRRGEEQFTVIVTGLAKRRGPASVAATLFAENEASIERREAARSEARLLRLGLRVPQGRPNKRDRRALTSLKSSDYGDGDD